jgi:hypothetical protein
VKPRFQAFAFKCNLYRYTVDRELTDAAEEAAHDAELAIENIFLPLPPGELARTAGAHASAAADALSRRIARYAASVGGLYKL